MDKLEVKSQLFLFEHQAEHTAQYVDKARLLGQQINCLQDKLKKNTRKLKEHKGSTETNYSNNAETDLAFLANRAKDQVPFY